MIKHYLSIAFRNLLRNKFQTLFSIAGLSVAFFCFGICSYFVYGLLTMDHYYDNHERVLALNEDHELHGTRANVIDQLIQEFPEIESVFRFYCERHPYHCQDLEENADLIVVECDTTLRHIYNPRLLAGSWHAAEHTPNSLLMTESYARRFFGKPANAIGKRFDCLEIAHFSDDHTRMGSYTVQAVVEDLPFNNTILEFTPLSAWVMNDSEGALHHQGSERWSNIIFYDPRIMLREGVDVDDFMARLDKQKIVETEPGNNAGEKRLWCLSADRTFNPRGSHLAFVLLIICCPGLLILLSALSNFFHLLLSSIMMRRREYTLRRAHGAQTRDLWMMVSTQVVVMMLLVGLCTLLIIDICAPLIRIDLDDAAIFAFDRNEMLRQSGLHIVAMLIVGVGVAWLAVARIRKDSLQETMKTSTGRRLGGHIFRNFIMGWQMLIGFVFIILLSALMLQIRTNEVARFSWLSNDEKNEIVTMPFYTYSQENRMEVESALQALPSVKEIGFNRLGHRHLNFYCWGKDVLYTESGDSIFSGITVADQSLISFLNLPLLEGRWPERPNEAVVDSRFIEHHGMGIGSVLTPAPNRVNDAVANGESICIVGVTDNLQLLTHKNNGDNVAYDRTGDGIYLFDHYHSGEVVCKCHPGQLEQMRTELKAYLVEHDILPNGGGSDFDFPTLYDEIREANSMEREFVGIFWLFAGIAIIITLLGIYSSITMDTTARRKEMAIRKINGAKWYHIVLRLSRLYLVQMTVTAAIAFPSTYLLFDLIGEYGYRETFDYGFLFYASIFLLMALLVAITIGIQVWKLATLEPAQVVKSEN